MGVYISFYDESQTKHLSDYLPNLSFTGRMRYEDILCEVELF